MLSQQFLESIEKIKRHLNPPTKQWVKDLNPQLLVIKEWMMSVGPRGGKVWTNSKTGKKVYGKKPGKDGGKSAAEDSKTVANTLVNKLRDGKKLNGGEIKSLAANLQSLSHAELKQLKSELAPYRSGKSKSDLVENLVTEAKRRASEVGMAERQAKKAERAAQKPKKEPKSKADAKPKGEEMPKAEAKPVEKPAEAPKAEGKPVERTPQEVFDAYERATTIGDEEHQSVIESIKAMKPKQLRELAKLIGVEGKMRRYSGQALTDAMTKVYVSARNIFMRADY